MDSERLKRFINKLPLSSDYKDEINYFIKELISDKNTNINSFTKISNYLYEVIYNSIDYKFAKQYYNINEDVNLIAGCSSINFDKYLARNFDLIYDDRTTIVVKTTGSQNTYATLGVCSYEKFTKEFIQSEEFNDLYKILPFIISDGINYAGLSASVNVVPVKTKSKIVIPSGEIKDIISSSMVVRYVLDNCATVDEAVTLLKTNIAIEPSAWADKQGFDLQFIIADNTKSKIISFKNGSIVDSDYDYITNFNVSDLILNLDGSVYTPATLDSTHKPSTTNKIASNGQGLERWNIINSAYDNLSDIDSIVDLLKSIVYTKAYTIVEPVIDEDKDESEDENEDEPVVNNVWHTEFTNNTNLTVDSSPEDFASVLEIARTMYANRSKDKNNPNYGTWETIHSSIYDRSNLSLDVYLHEDFTKKYTFKL